MDGLEVLGSEKERGGVLRPNRLRALALHIPWGEERINRERRRARVHTHLPCSQTSSVRSAERQGWTRYML